jgi:hypothetical protein
VPVAVRVENNDVAGLAFAIIGVLYAILLTFVVLSVWEANDAAQDNSRQEARAVVELRRYADTLPAEQRTRLRGLTDRYIDVVAHDEWPKMASGKALGQAGPTTVNDIWQVVDGTDPTDDNRASRQAEARTTLRELATARDARIAASDEGLPGVMWLALVVGSLITLGNALLFGVRGRAEYLALNAMLAAMSALLLFSVYQLEYPYQRGERVDAGVFLDAIGALAQLYNRASEKHGAWTAAQRWEAAVGRSRALSGKQRARNTVRVEGFEPPEPMAPGLQPGPTLRRRRTRRRVSGGIEPSSPDPQSGALPLSYEHHVCASGESGSRTRTGVTPTPFSRRVPAPHRLASPRVPGAPPFTPAGPGLRGAVRCRRRGDRRQRRAPIIF